MITLKTLVEFVENTEFSDEPIKLNPASTIINQKQFAESHLTYLKNAKGNKVYMPYYDRLVKFYRIINNTQNENKNNQKSPNQKT